MFNTLTRVRVPFTTAQHEYFRKLLKEEWGGAVDLLHTEVRYEYVGPCMRFQFRLCAPGIQSVFSEWVHKAVRWIDSQDGADEAMREMRRAQVKFHQIAQPEPVEEKKMSVNTEADKIVNSDRQGEYGDPVHNAIREAIVASVTTGKKLSPKDVVQVILAKKQVRTGQGAKHDTNVDLAGYAEILERVEKAMASGEAQSFAQSLVQHLLPKPKIEPMVVGEGILDGYGLRATEPSRGNSFNLIVSNFIRIGTFPYGRKVKIVLDE